MFLHLISLVDGLDHKEAVDLPEPL